MRIERNHTRNVVLTGMMAAIIAVVSQIIIPMPSGVPLTIGVFAVALSGAVLGWKRGFFAALVYVFAGAVGAPVFAGFKGGAQVLVSMTGGYLWIYPLLAMLSGAALKGKNKSINYAFNMVSALAGLALLELVGGLWWAHLSESMDLRAIMAYSFAAFIPKDCILTILAVVIGRQIRKTLIRCGLMDS